MVSRRKKQRSQSSSIRNPPASGQPKSGRDAPAQPNQALQGEGNYEAARKFDEAERQFVASGKVAAAARAAAPTSEAEEREMLAAEAEGRGRAKEEDPALRKGPGAGTPGKTSGRTPGNSRTR